MTHFPGQELIEKGIQDLEKKNLTIESLLVLIGAPKLKFLGIALPNHMIESPEHRLYEMLAKTEGNGAHSKYNSLIRRLVSFERAYACANK